MAEAIIHLPPSADPHSQPSVTVPVWITQSSLDGLNTLITYCEAIERHGNNGSVPGLFDTIMFYRTLYQAVRSGVNSPSVIKGAAEDRL
jgi:hypothetical protein